MLRGRGAATALTVLALAAAPTPALAEVPPGLIEEAEEAFAACADAGGEARILDGYRTVADLNGDGIADYVTDLGRMDCVDGEDAFCGPDGCPVAAWLSEADGDYARVDLGRVRRFVVVIASGGALPELRAEVDPAACSEAVEDVDVCRRTWAFETTDPDVPAAEPLPPPRPAAAASEPEPAPAVEPGWTLRRVPGSDPAALGGGTGRVASLAAFCLQGVPFLAVRFAEPPEAETIVIRFGFSQGEVAAEAAREETAAGAYVLSLGEGVLAARLAGRDSEVPLRAGDIDEGLLSLDGSTDAIRTALADCHDF